MFVSGTNGLAQSSRMLHGQVRNEATHNPINSVSILLVQVVNSDTIPLSFGFTDEQGRYSIRLTETKKYATYQLSARALGYASQSVDLQLNGAETQIKTDFSLLAKPLYLKEVLVKGILPVVEKNDTTTYKVKAFADGTERSVEDLLRKLPGVVVDDNGRITVRGKSVDKVMIEGEDLFSKNYRLITRTLSAGLLDKVDAIDNYQENPLLRDIERSDKLALNLRINDKNKTHWFGNASLTPGTAGRYEAEATLFSLRGRVKIGTLLNANTVGNDPAGALNGDVYTNTEADRMGISAVQVPAFNTTASSIPDVSAQRYVFSRVALPGLSWSYAAKKKWKTKGFAYLSDLRQDFQNRNNTRYRIDSQPVQVRDSTVNVRQAHQVTGQWQVDYQPVSNMTAKLTVGLNTSRQQEDGYANSQNLVLSDTIRTADQHRVLNHNYALNVVYRLAGRRALVADAGWNRYALPRQFDISSNRYNDVFPESGRVLTGLTQQTDHQESDQKIALRWLTVSDSASVWQRNMTTELAYTRQRETINAQLVTTDKTGNQRLSTDTTLQNKGTVYDQSVLRIGQQWQQQRGRFRFLVNGVIQWTSANLPTIMSYQKLWLLPTVRIGYTTRKGHRFIATASQEGRLPAFYDLLPGFLFSSYRTIQRGTPMLIAAKTQQYMATYQYSNWSRWFTVSGSLLASRTQSPFISTLSVSNLLSTATQTPYAGSLWFYNANGQAEKLLPAISAKLKIDGSVASSEQVFQTNEAPPTSVEIRSWSVGAFIFSTLSGPFNAELSLKSSKTTLLSSGNQSAQLLIRPAASLRWKPTPTTIIRLSGEQYSWQSENRSANSFFLDAQFFYTPQHSDWWVVIQARNLSDANRLTFTNFSPVLESQQVYQLQPRFLTLQVGRRF